MKALLAIIKYGIRQSWESAAYKYTIFIQPILFSALFYLINRLSKNDMTSLAIILKSGMISLWSSVCFSSLCDLQRERETRTLGSLLGTPTSLFKIILGKVIPNTIIGLISFFISSITLMLLSEKLVFDCTFLEIIFCILILLSSYITTAICIIPIFNIFDNTRLLINCIEYPIFMITGMAFPVSYLPQFMQWLGQLLPMTWGIKIVNSLLIEKKSIYQVHEIKIYVLMITAYVIMALLLFRKVEYEIRIKANINI